MTTDKQPAAHGQKPYIRGRWMVIGPNWLDGSGWTLCTHKEGKCKRCIAEYVRRQDAYRAARVNDDLERHVTIYREDFS